jgi:signal transduction histidine kinase
MVSVQVSDDGPGIPLHALDSIFERFYRVDTARSSKPAQGRALFPGHGMAEGGHGLGLAIVRWIAEAHGGEISVRSTPGQRTIFEARLPLAL